MAKDAGRKTEARLSSPVRQRSDVTILDIEHYAPFLLNAVSNAWQRRTSAIYRERFGLGIVEWRVLAMLNIEPHISANRVCEVIRLDKASVSRSLKLLSEEGYVLYEASPTDPRKRHWRLSEKGLAVHERILEIALSCESDLVAGVAPEHLETCLLVMRQMLANLD